MPQLGIFNILVGFVLIFLASSGGFFLSINTTEILKNTPEQLSQWAIILQKSAHGHTNLFGFLHIAFGLTLPYSRFTNNVKKIQTTGFLAGSIAMSLFLVLRSFNMPTAQLDLLGIVSAVFLCATLAALLSHISGLALKLYRI